MAWEWSPFGALVGEERVGGRGMDGLNWRRHRFGGVEILDVVGVMSARRVSRDLLRLSPRCGGCQGLRDVLGGRQGVERRANGVPRAVGWLEAATREGAGETPLDTGVDEVAGGVRRESVPAGVHAERSVTGRCGRWAPSRDSRRTCFPAPRCA